MTHPSIRIIFPPTVDRPRGMTLSPLPVAKKTGGHKVNDLLVRAMTRELGLRG